MVKQKILVIGSSNTDMTVKAEKLPRPGETIVGGVFTSGAGGKGANQAVAAVRLGGDVSLICKVGRDVLGDNAVKGYEADGLDTSGVLRSEQPSGVALISVDAKGENCIVVAPGANMDLTVGDIERSADRIREADILLLQLEIPVESVLRAAEIASEAGVCVILNPAPYAEVPEELFRYVTLFIPNETELSSFSGVEVRDEASAVRACQVMMDKGVSKLIVTLGSQGSLIYDGVNAIRIDPVPVHAADTTAAGDTFCGALCVALAEGEDLVSAANFASRAAALSVTRMGAQSSMPFRDELLTLQ